MRIACLQFNPQLGQVKANITRADELLAVVDLEKLDLLVLPELAFTGISWLYPNPTTIPQTYSLIGYNHPSLSSILPYLEPTASGPSTQWAFSTASRFNCIVSVGYPEKTSVPIPPSSRPTLNPSSTANYNSTVTVGPDGKILAHYRKTHLYYTDETWAHESDTGWLTTNLPLLPLHNGDNNLPTAFGICMDLNPHLFTAPWKAYEFASHALRTNAHLVILSTAWTLAAPTSISPSSSLPTSQDSASTTTTPPPDPSSSSSSSSSSTSSPSSSPPPANAKVPSHETLTYWLNRLTPLLSSSSSTNNSSSSSSPAERIVVIANRCGRERDVAYAGTSTVMGLGNGVVRVWGTMGEGEEGVLVVDTEEMEQWRGSLVGSKE